MREILPFSFFGSGERGDEAFGQNKLTYLHTLWVKGLKFKIFVKSNVR